ncbi:MAG: putative glycoside hydrolase [Clostridia bacterium]|nr:putative glycoside hydrolase [Clostridia bacterium]
MENSKYFIMLFVFVIIGIFLGVLYSAYSNLKLSNFNTDTSNYLSSGNKLSNLDNIESLSFYASGDLSGDIANNSTNANTPSLVLTPIDIKAVYLTGWTAGTKNKRTTIIENLKNYGYNAVVIDIKDEAGNISYKSNVQTAIDTLASKNMIADIKNVIDDFHNSDIYVIGRIVTFKDPNYAKKIPDNAYKTADGSLWKDYSGNNWPNPYNVASWDYPISLAKEAATLGFDEIQFDYIRFPSSEGKTKNISFGFDSETKTKSDIINEFLRQVMKELKNYNVVISADVFGITTKKSGDFEHIGQDFLEIAKIVDVICPMIYPSHYGLGEYGIEAPDKEPYKIVKRALEDAQKQYALTSGDIKLAKIRPYLQDFTASWLKKGKYIVYGTTAVTAQLQACHDLDINDFILWDPSNKYAFEAINNVITPTFESNLSGDSLKDVSGEKILQSN